jgi:hypothetical protein
LTEAISDHLTERFLDPIDEEMTRVRKERETLQGQLALLDDEQRRLTRLRNALLGPKPGPKHKPAVKRDYHTSKISAQKVELLYQHLLSCDTPQTIRQLRDHFGWHQTTISTGLRRLREADRARLAGAIDTPTKQGDRKRKARVYTAITPAEEKAHHNDWLLAGHGDGGEPATTT